METAVMDLLRESTRDLHNDAEGQDFQRQLGSGSVHRAAYVRYLAQLKLLHEKLASLLLENADDRYISQVLKSYHTDNSSLARDLQFLRPGEEDKKPLSSTAGIMQDLEDCAAKAPYSLLGHLYVLEGSTNGAKFMAKNIRDGLGLPPDRGATYFDRHGDEQRQRWTAFKQDMNTLDFSPAEKGELVSSAKRMFQAFFEIGSELLTANSLCE